MSEEAEGQDAGAEAVAGGADPAAVALALGGASREEADAFLRDQRAVLRNQNSLIDIQKHHLHEQLKNLRLNIWEKYLGVLLRIATAFIGIVIAAGLAAMIWDAAHDNGLVVESFSVPPDLAARGITGQVIATQMLDEFAALQAQSVSSRAPSSYTNNWGDDLKVEIPETGVSIGELTNYLHQLLGHQTHISGEVMRTSAGIELTARAGNDTVETVSGSEAQIRSLLQQAAAAVFAATQPNRYAAVLRREGKLGEEEALLRAHAYSGPILDRTWSYYQLSLVLAYANGGTQAAYDSARRAVALDSDFPPAWERIAQMAHSLGRYEEALLASRTLLRLLDQNVSRDLVPDFVLTLRHATSGLLADMAGDYGEEVRQYIAQYPALDFSADAGTQIQQAWLHIGTVDPETFINSHGHLAGILAREHDLAEAKRFLAEKPGYITALSNYTGTLDEDRKQLSLNNAAQYFGLVELAMAQESQNWAQLLGLAQKQRFDERNVASIYGSTTLTPLLAYAEAATGNFIEAHADIDKTPGDCDPCLRSRGKIDAAQKNFDGAAYWFADAVKRAPSIPFAYADWGQMLLDKGDPDAAIAKFKLANQKGPHFADPLEGWGEALMAKNKSHLALAKFAEANKYAPNWGRLHLKWGEALYYSGHGDAAKAEFARAAQLDLTAAEKTELAQESRP